MKNLDTISIQQLDTISGGQPSGRFLVNHPRFAAGFLAGHPGREAVFSQNHPCAWSRIEKIQDRWGIG